MKPSPQDLQHASTWMREIWRGKDPHSFMGFAIWACSKAGERLIDWSGKEPIEYEQWVQAERKLWELEEPS